MNPLNDHLIGMLQALLTKESEEMANAFDDFKDKRTQVKALIASAGPLLDEEESIDFLRTTNTPLPLLREYERDCLFIKDA